MKCELCGGEVEYLKNNLVVIERLRKDNEDLKQKLTEQIGEGINWRENEYEKEIKKLCEVVKMQTEWIKGIQIRNGEYVGYRKIIALGEQALEEK